MLLSASYLVAVSVSCCFCVSADSDEILISRMRIVWFLFLDKQVRLQDPKPLLFVDGLMYSNTCFHEIPRLVVSAYH